MKQEEDIKDENLEVAKPYTQSEMEEYLSNHNKIMEMFKEQGLTRNISTKSAKNTGDFPS